MILPYKEKLFKNIDNLGIKLNEHQIISYAKELGFNSDDLTKCYFFLKSVKDDKYCGINYHEDGDFCLYDGSVLYWFTSRKDAELFACPESLNASSDIGVNIFAKYYRRHYNGMWFLYGFDVAELDSITHQPKHIARADNPDINFTSVDECAAWLVRSGYAKDVKSASRQLEKHLRGETSYCYKMKFILC